MVVPDQPQRCPGPPGAVAALAPILAFEPESLRCPYPGYAVLREIAPVVWVPEIEAFVVSRFDDIAEVVRDPGRFSSSAAMGPRPLPVLLQEMFNERRRREGRPERPVREPDPILLSADPPLHTRHRALLSRAFTGRRVALIEGRIEELATELVDAFADRGRCELVAELAVPLPLTVLAEILGVADGDRATFKRWSDDFASLFGAAEPDEDRLFELAATAFEFEEFFRAQVEARRTEGRDDLLTDVVEARVEGEEPLRTDEIVTMFAQLLIAGNETTTKLLTAAARCLAERPDLATALRERPESIPSFVEEVLRLESPIQGFWRIATADTEIAGEAVAGGSRVLLLYGFRQPRRLGVPRPGRDRPRAPRWAVAPRVRARRATSASARTSPARKVASRWSACSRRSTT